MSQGFHYLMGFGTHSEDGNRIRLDRTEMIYRIE